MTSLAEVLKKVYRAEDRELAERAWKKSPFKMFSPDMSFISFRDTNRAIDAGDNDFFLRYVRNNFFPDKTLEEAREAMIHAMNRGINSLNDLCKRFLPDEANLFYIQDAPESLSPLEAFSEARNIWRTESPRRNRRNHEKMFRAYNLIRAWGLGHLVLLIDESPQIFDSVVQSELIDDWMQERLEFSNPSIPNANGEVAWQTKAGIKVYGTEERPFRRRAKIYDEKGHIRYGSILTKMFLRQGYVEDTHDTYGVEFVVGSEEDEKKLIGFFSYYVRGTAVLERFKHMEEPGPPAFYRTKFVLRVPVRVSDSESMHIDSILAMEDPTKGKTLMEPLKRYKRIGVEVQIRNRNLPYEHELYKSQQYMRVFPLWYPREIYEPLLKKRSGCYLLPPSNQGTS